MAVSRIVSLNFLYFTFYISLEEDTPPEEIESTYEEWKLNHFLWYPDFVVNRVQTEEGISMLIEEVE